MINSKVTGEGDALVFLHGFGEDLTLWTEIAHYFEKTNQVILLDLPGFGLSTPLKGEFSIETIAELVHNHIRNELETDKYFVLGHSLGGYVALAIADHYREKLKGIGLINSTSYEDSPEKKENRLKTIDFINKHGTSFFLQSFVPNLFTPANQELFAEKVKKVTNMGKNLTDSVLTSYMMAMRNRPDRSNLLVEIENFLFVAGENDDHITSEERESQILALINPSFGHILSNVAHMSMYEAKNDVKHLISLLVNRH